MNSSYSQFLQHKNINYISIVRIIFQFSAANVTYVTEPAQSYGSEPQRANCPYCHNQITTRTEHEPTMLTHIVALLLCGIA